jgi:hypothetical protein
LPIQTAANADVLPLQAACVAFLKEEAEKHPELAGSEFDDNNGSSNADGQSTAPISSVNTPVPSNTAQAGPTTGKKLKLIFNSASAREGLMNGGGGRSDDEDND